eukprot:6570498-Prymnesium_polylepis.1
MLCCCNTKRKPSSSTTAISSPVELRRFVWKACIERMLCNRFRAPPRASKSEEAWKHGMYICIGQAFGSGAIVKQSGFRVSTHKLAMCLRNSTLTLFLRGVISPRGLGHADAKMAPEVRGWAWRAR